MTRRLCKEILNPETNERINKQFEILIVPGGMIIYRIWNGSNSMTATFVPLNADGDTGPMISQWLYGDVL